MIAAAIIVSMMYPTYYYCVKKM